MRIRIDIDGQGGAPPSLSASGLYASTSDDAGVDGGAGPGFGGSGDSQTDSDGSSDTGPPPDWLLESVAAAEAEDRGGASTGGAPTKDAPVEGEHGDAGPGPSE